MQVSEYYVAGRRVPAIYNGMATGSDWMSAASFIGMAGSLYLLGYGGLAFILGWTGGYVLVAILLAPYLRKFGQYTVPDFLGARFGGNVARFVGVVVLITASFVYVVAQIVGVGIITQRFLDVSFAIAVFIGLAGILVCSMMGGMRAVTWTQVAQYIVPIIAYLSPAILMSVKLTGVPVPQIMYGVALEKIEALEASMRAAGQVMLPHTGAFQAPNGQFDMSRAINFFALIFCLMVGTASLPHILMRYFTTPSVREARQSVAWSLFFIFLLYFTASAYAAFAKLEIYQNVIGKPIADLPAWLKNWQLMSPYGVTWIGVNDINRDGILQLNEFRIHPDVVVLATPEIAGLPYVIAGLVAAGGLAAALSTADGLLLALANALSHDIYYRMIDPQVLPHDRPAGADQAPALCRADAADHGRSRRSLHGWASRRRHPVPRLLGLLDRRCRAFRRAGDGRLVQEDDQCRCDRRHAGRLRGHLRVPAAHGVRGAALHPAVRRQGGDHHSVPAICRHRHDLRRGEGADPGAARQC